MKNERDPDVAALHRLIGDTVERRRDVADALDVNEQTLYQIVKGIPLPSGRARSVGRQLREKLDTHFPHWRDQVVNVGGSTDPGSGRPGGAATTADGELEAALRVVLGAVASLTPLRWEAVRGQLDRLVAEPELFAEAVPELAHQLRTAPRKRRKAA